MTYTKNLSELNAQIAKRCMHLFSSDVRVEQDKEGALYFREPDGSSPQANHIPTHVVVRVPSSVLVHVEGAEGELRALYVQVLVDSLSSSVCARYNPRSVGQFALRIAPSEQILDDVHELLESPPRTLYLFNK